MVKKAKVTYFIIFFGPTPLHDHAASRLVKMQKISTINTVQELPISPLRYHFDS